MFHPLKYFSIFYMCTYRQFISSHFLFLLFSLSTPSDEWDISAPRKVARSNSSSLHATIWLKNVHHVIYNNCSRAKFRLWGYGAGEKHVRMERGNFFFAFLLSLNIRQNNMRGEEKENLKDFFCERDGWQRVHRKIHAEFYYEKIWADILFYGDAFSTRMTENIGKCLWENLSHGRNFCAQKKFVWAWELFNIFLFTGKEGFCEPLNRFERILMKRNFQERIYLIRCERGLCGNVSTLKRLILRLNFLIRNFISGPDRDVLNKKKLWEGHRWTNKFLN